MDPERNNKNKRRRAAQSGSPLNIRPIYSGHERKHDTLHQVTARPPSPDHPAPVFNMSVPSIPPSLRLCVLRSVLTSLPAASASTSSPHPAPLLLLHLHTPRHTLTHTQQDQCHCHQPTPSAHTHTHTRNSFLPLCSPSNSTAASHLL